GGEGRLVVPAGIAVEQLGVARGIPGGSPEVLDHGRQVRRGTHGRSPVKAQSTRVLPARRPAARNNSVSWPEIRDQEVELDRISDNMIRRPGTLLAVLHGGNSRPRSRSVGPEAFIWERSDHGRRGRAGELYRAFGGAEGVDALVADGPVHDL